MKTRTDIFFAWAQQFMKYFLGVFTTDRLLDYDPPMASLSESTEQNFLPDMQNTNRSWREHNKRTDVRNSKFDSEWLCPTKTSYVIETPTKLMYFSGAERLWHNCCTLTFADILLSIQRLRKKRYLQKYFSFRVRHCLLKPVSYILVSRSQY